METTRKITNEEREKLYAFTRQHYVEHYDLQTEFVDELTTKIENHWAEHPEDDFDTALQKAFKTYGVFGFSDIVDQRRNQIEKRYLKWALKQLLDFLKFPKIFISVGLIAFFILIFRVFTNYNNVVVLVINALLFVVMIVFAYQNYKKYKHLFQQTQRKYLYQELVFRSSFFTFILLFFMNFTSQISLQSESQTFPIYGQILYSIAFAFVLIMLYQIYVGLPKKFLSHKDRNL